MLETDRLNYGEIPDGCFVIRKKNTCSYLHFQSGLLFFKEKMHGCFVVYKDVAEKLLEWMVDESNCINNENNTENQGSKKYETVTFEKAFKEHGLEERQKFYN